MVAPSGGKGGWGGGGESGSQDSVFDWYFCFLRFRLDLHAAVAAICSYEWLTNLFVLRNGDDLLTATPPPVSQSDIEKSRRISKSKNRADRISPQCEKSKGEKKRYRLIAVEFGIGGPFLTAIGGWWWWSSFVSRSACKPVWLAELVPAISLAGGGPNVRGPSGGKKRRRM